MFKFCMAPKAKSDPSSLEYRHRLNFESQAYVRDFDKKLNPDPNSLDYRHKLNSESQAYAREFNRNLNTENNFAAPSPAVIAPPPPAVVAPQPVVQEPVIEASQPVVQDADSAYLGKAYEADYRGMASKNALEDFYSNGVDWRYDPSADTVNRYRNY